jgi:hypothetical protein
MLKREIYTRMRMKVVDIGDEREAKSATFQRQ